MKDLTDYQESGETRTILSCGIRLDKKTMLEILAHDHVSVNGVLYKVPERVLLDCLINKRFGSIKLELEQVEL